MARRPAQVSSGPAGVPSGRDRGPTSLWLPSQAQGDEAPTPQTLISEGMICIGATRVVFYDPAWGPVSFDLAVWRHHNADLPEYEVTVD